MYKLIEPFEISKIYKDTNKKTVINQIYKDLKNLNTDNIKIKIKDIHTGKDYSYFILNKKKSLINFKKN